MQKIMKINYLFAICAIICIQPFAKCANSEFQKEIKYAKEKIFPAVVFIKVISENFKSGKKTMISASGSGVVISKNGEVLTNWHVVENSKNIRCLLYDGTALKATIIGTDKDTGIALLQLEKTPNKTYKFAQIATSKK